MDRALSTVWSIKCLSSKTDNLAIANTLNQVPKPLLVVYQLPEQEAFGKANRDNFGRMLSLSHLLKPSVSVEFITQVEIVTFPAGYSHYFCYLPEQALVEAIEQRYAYAIKPVENIPSEKLLSVLAMPGKV